MITRTALSLASRGRLSILIFHRVLREPDPLLPSEPSAAEFEAIAEHVKARFTALPLSEAVARLQSGTLPSAALSITFDDGHALRRTWRVQGLRTDIPVLALDPEQGRLLPWKGTLPARELWLLYPARAPSASPMPGSGWTFCRMTRMTAASTPSSLKTA